MKLIWMVCNFTLFCDAAMSQMSSSWEEGFSDQYKTENTLGQYSFGYNEDHSSGGSFRRETGDRHGNRVGSYGLRVSDGRVRVVKYVADAHGFRAHVITNEPGIASTDDRRHLAVARRNIRRVYVPGLRYVEEPPHVAFRLPGEEYVEVGRNGESLRGLYRTFRPTESHTGESDIEEPGDVSTPGEVSLEQSAEDLYLKDHSNDESVGEHYKTFQPTQSYAGESDSDERVDVVKPDELILEHESYLEDHPNSESFQVLRGTFNPTSDAAESDSSVKVEGHENFSTHNEASSDDTAEEAHFRDSANADSVRAFQAFRPVHAQYFVGETDSQGEKLIHQEDYSKNLPNEAYPKVSTSGYSVEVYHNAFRPTYIKRLVPSYAKRSVPFVKEHTEAEMHDVVYLRHTGANLTPGTVVSENGNVEGIGNSIRSQINSHEVLNDTTQNLKISRNVFEHQSQGRFFEHVTQPDQGVSRDKHPSIEIKSHNDDNIESPIVHRRKLYGARQDESLRNHDGDRKSNRVLNGSSQQHDIDVVADGMVNRNNMKLPASAPSKSSSHRDRMIYGLKQQTPVERTAKRESVVRFGN